MSNPPSSFKTLQQEHARLLKAQQTGQDVTQAAQDYLAQVQFSGAQIEDPRQREQLRANLRYWASYIYEKTRTYPQAELSPYTGPARRRWWLLIPGALLLCALVAIGLVVAFDYIRPLETPDPTAEVVETEVQWTDTPIPTHTLTPSVAIWTPTPAPDLVQTVVILNRTLQPIVVTPAPAPLNILALDSPPNGAQLWLNDQTVTLSGRYSDLDPGWTIYLVVQPLSTSGRYFGLPLYTLPKNAPRSGSWQVEVEMQALLPGRVASDTLVLTLAVGNDAGLNTSLAEMNKQGGAQALPGEMLVLRSAPIVWYISRR